MKRNLAAWLICSGLISLSVGCNHGVVRGQNPGPMAFNGGEMSGQHQLPGLGMQAGPVYYDGPASGQANCPSCPSCPQGQADVWRPTHHHTYEYNPPRNLKYPAPNQQPAVVQYPYYTCKGPSDFFYQGP